MAFLSWTVVTPVLLFVVVAFVTRFDKTGIDKNRPKGVRLYAMPMDDLFDPPDRDQGDFGPADRAPVLLPMPLDGTYDYAVPDGITLKAGQLVWVPLGPRRVIGVVWSKPLGRGADVPAKTLKPIEEPLALPPLPPDMLDFIEFVAAYTLTQAGQILRMVLSSREALQPLPLRRVIRPNTIPAALKLTPARRRVLEAIKGMQDPSTRQLAHAAAVSDGVVTGLVKAGALATADIPTDSRYEALTHDASPLNAEQAAAADALKQAVKKGGYTPFLLDGVTGSGKTEVYFEAIAEALRSTDGQVLVLLPEIGLTRQWLDRFKARFGGLPGAWHSDVGTAERRRVWGAVQNGTVRVVVGARSALFLPFQKLSAIIVDEEHDPSFKQEDGVLYQARDMAVLRALKAQCPILLASATPSIESHVNVQQNRYQLLSLKERFGPAKLPQITAIDMRQAGLPATEWIAPDLADAIRDRLSRGEQSLLFLNRRGYAPLTLCRSCGHRFGCPDCSTWLVEHRFHKKLMCHQCGWETMLPDTCPECDSAEAFAACGPGVERLAEEALEKFPGARLAVLTSDTPGGGRQARAILQGVESGSIDIIIGTQLITKGYHFPLLTCVGVVDADLGLKGGDLRASERTYQQLEQVAGRSGRAERPGFVYVQTHEPEHPVIQALLAQNRDAFIAAEMADREATGMPPFGRLAAIIVSAPAEQDAIAVGRLLAATAPAGPTLGLFGPAPAPFTRLRGDYRIRLLLKTDKTTQIQSILRPWLSRFYQARAAEIRLDYRKAGMKKVRIKVDIDPYSFL